ncbi:hypothetical protein [Phocaeicola sp.]
MEKELWYKRNDHTQNLSNKEKIKLACWRICDFCLFKPTPTFLSFWRVSLLRLFGATIGKGCYISPKATILMPWNLKMGNISSIDDYAFIKSEATIIIGDYVSIGNFVRIIQGGHDLWSRGFEVDISSIKIGNGAFIGAGAFIGKGCDIGQMAVVGACTHLTKSVPDNTIISSVPKYVKCQRLSNEEYEQYRFNYIK